MPNGQTEQKQGFGLFLFARRRTKVRREARFVRSIKHKILTIYVFWVVFRSSYKYLTCSNPSVYLVLCDLRFFYIPFFD